MLNLLTDFNLCLLARVPTALAVPVLELDLVFEGTVRADHLYACRQRKREWIGRRKTIETADLMDIEKRMCSDKKSCRGSRQS